MKEFQEKPFSSNKGDPIKGNLYLEVNLLYTSWLLNCVKVHGKGNDISSETKGTHIP